LESVRKVSKPFIKEFPAVTKIWLIGSIAKPIFFDMRSDVDIVVDGLPAESYFKAYGFFEKRLNSKVDLILYSDIKDKDKKMLDGKVVIYEKTAV